MNISSIIFRETSKGLFQCPRFPSALLFLNIRSWWLLLFVASSLCCFVPAMGAWAGGVCTLPDCCACAYLLAEILRGMFGLRGVHSARLRREAPTHCGHCGGSLTRHLRCLRHTLAFHRIGSCSLRRRSYAGCVYTPPALPVRGFSLVRRLKRFSERVLSWIRPFSCSHLPRRTAFPFDSAFPACDGRNDSSILLVRPSERAFVQESPCYPSAAASADSFPY